MEDDVTFYRQSFRTERIKLHQKRGNESEFTQCFLTIILGAFYQLPLCPSIKLPGWYVRGKISNNSGNCTWFMCVFGHMARSLPQFMRLMIKENWGFVGDIFCAMLVNVAFMCW